MTDQYGREINYLRLSLTDRCNLKCIYCMPEGGMELIPYSALLSYEELLRIVHIASELGIDKIKLTGGEPLMRKGISGFIKSLKALSGISEVTMTTNGVFLKSQVRDLVEAGLNAVNISLDASGPEEYLRITGEDGWGKVMEGIREACNYPGLHVKINCVPLKDVRVRQYIELAGISYKMPVDVRFIEMMPIGLGSKYEGRAQEEILGQLKKVYGTPLALRGKYGNGPCIYLQFPGFIGKVGFISALSHKFCHSCNRVRLTADGFLKPCLQYACGTELKKPIRDGASDNELKQLMYQAIYNKPKGHQFGSEINEQDMEQNGMSRIGG